MNEAFGGEARSPYDNDLIYLSIVYILLLILSFPNTPCPLKEKIHGKLPTHFLTPIYFPSDILLF